MLGEGQMKTVLVSWISSEKLRSYGRFHGESDGLMAAVLYRSAK
jgi:hypothetical protein